MRPCVMAVALALAAGCGGRSTPSTSAARIDQAARDAGFRGALLVARGGTVIARSAYGPADEGAGIANAPATRFRIGSVTKQFVAAAILLRRDRGHLSVEDSCASTSRRVPTNGSRSRSGIS